MDILLSRAREIMAAGRARRRKLGMCMTDSSCFLAVTLSPVPSSIYKEPRSSSLPLPPHYPQPLGHTLPRDTVSHPLFIYLSLSLTLSLSYRGCYLCSLDLFSVRSVSLSPSLSLHSALFLCVDPPCPQQTRQRS